LLQRAHVACVEWLPTANCRRQNVHVCRRMWR
jgi:hypothetical protein